MPIYEYRCENGHTFDVMQSMIDDPVSVCEVCGEPVQRVFHPVAVHFKGSGFYSTDYGKQRAADDGAAADTTEKKADQTGKDAKAAKPDKSNDSSSAGASGGSDKKSGSRGD